MKSGDETGVVANFSNISSKIPRPREVYERFEQWREKLPIFLSTERAESNVRGSKWTS